MSIKKYFADSDNTITNAFRENLQTRGTGANMGASPVLEVFSIYGQASSGSTELERILIKFPINKVISDRSNSLIPISGSVSFFLTMYNARHNQTTPRDSTLVIAPITKAWQEGTGLDMSEYRDVTNNGLGSNWINAGKADPWTKLGGDYLASSNYSQNFPIGNEDLKINITGLVEKWISGAITNYGVGVHLTASNEAYFSNSAGVDKDNQLYNPTGAKDTYYTKKFFGKGTGLFFKLPAIEAAWDSSKKDDRGNFYASSSLVPGPDNLRTLFLYNVIGGRLVNIPEIGTGDLRVQLYTSASGGDQIGATVVGGYSSKGIYTASFSLDTSASVAYDRWYNPSLTDLYNVAKFNIKQYAASNFNPYPNLVTNLTNLRANYSTRETARFRFYVREKDWSPTIYTVATSRNDTQIIESASYQIYRVTDDLVVVPYNTGSDKGTEMSFDVSGNYFDLKMDFLEPGYSYGINVAYYDETVNSYVEQPYDWKFRVENV
tara:strand:+ start:4435 stop:5910 length:1476 start_codon:yes stop_codon:yes gene_type:complete